MESSGNNCGDLARLGMHLMPPNYTHKNIEGGTFLCRMYFAAMKQEGRGRGVCEPQEHELQVRTP